MTSLNIGVIGAGIVGLSHAWLAAERGHRVIVFERTGHACGASVRNFGMIWPIGQPPGELHRTALRSRDRWRQLCQQANLWFDACGSIHLAHRDDELRVLAEFQENGSSLGYQSQLLTARETTDRVPAANPDGLLGGLFSPTEICVNARDALQKIPRWLADKYGVRFEFNTTVHRVDETTVRAADGRTWNCERAIVCGGSDFETLFPEILAQSELIRCKLQMMKTQSQPNGWRIGPMIASGLTLRHYKCFEICPSLTALKQRVVSEAPELDRLGIHVMASQIPDGSVILGDSHEYDAAIEPFDKAEIDEFILRELKKIIRLPTWSLAEHWNGVYAKHPTRPIFAAEPIPQVHIRVGTGGAGMTMSFGLAERDWEQWN